MAGPAGRRTDSVSFVIRLSFSRVTSHHTNVSGDTASMWERILVFIFCFLAAIRVSIFLAAFPFFSNVDEGLHFDVVVKYSHLQPPRGVETISSETAKFLALCSSPEYLNKLPPGFSVKPLWKQPPGVNPAKVPPLEFWTTYQNFESGQMPLYYVIDGAWMRLGELIGFEQVGLLYWNRFLNSLIVALIVWLSYVVARLVFPNNSSLRLAVPLLIAFLPQDAFYEMQNDVLLPLCFGLLFLLLLKGSVGEMPSKKWAFATGAMFAATYLVKTSSLPLLAVAVIILITRFWRWRHSDNCRKITRLIFILAGVALIPITLWTIWFKIAFGDATGSSQKIHVLGWTHKPFWEWFEHPIFSPQGAWTFIHDLIASFWRGEFTWHRSVMASGPMDLFYVISSIVFLILALVSIFWPKESLSQTRAALSLSWWCFFALISFYGLLSVMFDFGTSQYPSRDFPYFASGRLMSGVLIPFFLLYVRGLDRLWRFTGRKWPVLVSAGVIAVVVTISEIILTLPVFPSEFNWFHM